MTEDIWELLYLVCLKLIELGVQEHVAWVDYNFHYMPIGYYFQDCNCSCYNEELLNQYCSNARLRYEREEVTYKHLMSVLRAASRVREYFHTETLSHVCTKGNSKVQLTYMNESLLYEFLDWNVSLVAQKTLHDMESTIRQYLQWLQKRGVMDALQTNAHCFSGYLADVADKYKDSSLYNIQLYLKKFHQFLREEKGVDVPYEFVLSLPITREKKIIQPPTWDEITRTIAQIDRETTKGKRDYAIVLLAARCGMRASDITLLKLTDIDWRGHKINFIQQKTDTPITLPLLEDVGEALKEYILNGRPTSIYKEVFLRVEHPYRPFRCSVAITHIWKGYQEKAGIERYAGDGKGFHSLRRRLGSDLTESDIPITTTAQILGHTDLNSSKQYISLDTKRLKECSLELPEVTREAGHD